MASWTQREEDALQRVCGEDEEMMMSSSDSDTFMDNQKTTNGYLSDTPSETGASTTLQREIKALRKRLRESERTRKHLRGLLEQARDEDKKIDRKFRRVVGKCRTTRQSSSSHNAAYNNGGNPMDLGCYGNESSDERDDEESEGSCTEDEREALSIRRFLERVERGKREGKSVLRGFRFN
ncbi:hypothetical protein HK097_002264 [Rhizophlyctis rosea]|uniref:Uncharacterized protein n=1 Tax=Rhizophlyctis rosea TaxID=64517 RepID=A0AAD5SB66_9FUNG|nr:hypothetical protein HK097_002264 [Rhizophlyctis rosea]